MESKPLMNGFKKMWRGIAAGAPRIWLVMLPLAAIGCAKYDMKLEASLYKNGEAWEERMSERNHWCLKCVYGMPKNPNEKMNLQIGQYAELIGRNALDSVQIRFRVFELGKDGHAARVPIWSNGGSIKPENSSHAFDVANSPKSWH